MSDSTIFCSNCNGNHLLLKYQATYEYSYVIDSNAPGLCNEKELLSYLYDSREQKEAHQFIECGTCGTKYPCYFGEWNGGITAQAIQAVLASGPLQTTD